MGRRGCPCSRSTRESPSARPCRRRQTLRALVTRAPGGVLTTRSAPPYTERQTSIRAEPSHAYRARHLARLCLPPPCLTLPDMCLDLRWATYLHHVKGRRLRRRLGALALRLRPGGAARTVELPLLRPDSRRGLRPTRVHLAGFLAVFGGQVGLRAANDREGTSLTHVLDRCVGHGLAALRVRERAPLRATPGTKRQDRGRSALASPTSHSGECLYWICPCRV